ncbi:hypothetical protein BUE80_DR006985 [Diplocarpon rosae]|nr:hypothetical protein BUE80_DR006985 [Diplocarpon rosae]
MRFSLLAGLAFATAISAQDPYYRNQTAPFKLVLSSHNKTIDGSYLYACHEGAAIEGLCVAKSVSSYSGAFTFNYTDINGPPSYPEFGYLGLITWELQGSNFNVSSSLNLDNSPTSNVAVPLFYPGDQGFTNFAFDKGNKLFVAGFLDNTVSPPAYKAKAYYRWYVCLTNAGYTYTTLAWSVGSARPENPSCDSVDVKRVFI